MKRILTALCALALCALTAFAQTAAGEWEAAMETPGGQFSQSKLSLKADGEKLTGTLKGQRGEYPVTGSLKGKEFRLSYAINYNDNMIPVTITGVLDGDAIKGTADIANGNFQGAWSAKRTGGATASIAPVGRPVVQSGSPANGAWDVVMNTPQGAQNFRAEFTVEGETLKGQLKRGNAPQGLPVTGTAKGKEVSFSYSVKFQEMDLKITMTGTIDGDNIKGQADFGGFAQDEWSAKRASAAAAPAAPAASAAPASGNDLSGTWDGQVETSAGSGTPTLTLKQEGEKLTGTYKGQLGEYPLTGTVKGDAVEFSFKVSGQVEGTVIYKGTVSNGTMKGTIDLAGVASGTFTAKKK
jgi:hypothetical protein